MGNEEERNNRVISKSFYVEYDEDADFINDAFGLPNGYEKEIYNIPRFEFDNILYITGESGSGKSTLMRDLYEETTVVINKHEPIYKVVSDNVEESLKWLSYVGLGDATLYSLTYNQLSDSQQQRIKILIMFLENDFIVIDEFLSTLDRKTAQSVAYMFQKIVRRNDKKAVVVTAHDDLNEFLMPDVTISGKSFPSKFVVEEKTISKNPFDEVVFRYGGKDEYKESDLGELHYKGKYTGGTKEYLYADYEGRIIGVLVSTNRIGNNGRKIARVVVHPSYRGVGIGKRMVEKYIADYPLTEVIAVMAKYNPFFEKAGMIRVPDSVVKSPSGLITKLSGVGFNRKKWGNREYCHEFVKEKKNRVLLSDFANYANKLIQPGGKKLSKEELKDYLLNDKQTAGRALFQFRPKQYAKYKTEKLIELEE